MKKYAGLILLTSKQERLRPVVKVIKLFFLVTDEEAKYAEPFVPGNPLQPNTVEHFRCFHISVKPWNFPIITDQDLRARPEPTQLEHLSDASFLGKLLVLANVRLDCKVIARYKQSSLFGLVVNNEGKKFDKIDTSITLVRRTFSRSAGLSSRTRR